MTNRPAISAIWRSGDLLVAHCGEGYFVIDATGHILERHIPSDIAGHWTLTSTSYAIRGDDLVCTSTFYTLSGPDPEVDSVVLAGLQPVDDEPARRFVQTVLDDDLVLAEERRLRGP